MLRNLLLCASLLALAACPGPSGKDGGTPPPDSGPVDAGHDGGTKDAGVKDAGPPDAGFQNVTVEDWCQDYAIAQCSRDARCLSISVNHFDECLQRYLSVCDQLAYTRGVKEGRLQFLSQQADDCLNGMWTGPCSALPTACSVVFTGLVAPDGGCILSQECDNTGFCYQYDNQCPHHCRGYVGLGAPCDGFSIQCRPDEGWCGLDGGAYVCQPQLADGQPCTAYDSCLKGSICSNSVCVKQNAEPGGECGSNSVYPYCPDEYFCRQDLGLTPPPPGTCQRKGGVGEVCNGYYACLPSLRCSSTYETGTCEAKGDVGQACSNYTDCQDGLFCEPRSATCQTLPLDGGDCTDHGSFYACHVGYFCDFSAPDQQYVCTAQQAEGGSCSYDGQCLSNDCQYGAFPDGGYGGICVSSCSQRADGGF